MDFRQGHISLILGSDGVIVQALPMSFVANNLAMHLGQPVVDRTGLTGDYDFTLKIFSDEVKLRSTIMNKPEQKKPQCP